MKIKNYILFLLAALSLLGIFQNDTYSQLPNQGMTLWANRNQHPGSGGNLYSAIWGYKAPNGREYAILGCYSGTAFIDVTDSANIVECDFHPWLNSNWREMKTYSHYAYIVTEATGSGQGLQIIDLQYLPDSIHFVRNFTYSGYTHTHSIQQDGPYLYLNGGNVTTGLADIGGTKIIDLSVDPENPVVRGGWGTYYVHDSRVRNDTMYVANIYDPPGTITVVNVANKNAPVTIASWVNNPNPFPHNVALLAGRTYILTTDETSTPNGKLKVWNISNLSNVTFVTNWLPTGITTAIVHNVEIYGNYALVAHYAAGIRLINISNPAVPVEVAWYDTYTTNNSANYNGCWGVYMFPSGKIIASDRQTGLYVVKPTVPIVGINEPSANTPDRFELKQNYPNPFNPSTSIEFSIKNASHVTLKVYDVVGRQVALLADDYKPAGDYRISYDAGMLSSGVYYYTLSTDNGFTETKKMILTK